MVTGNFARWRLAAAVVVIAVPFVFLALAHFSSDAGAEKGAPTVTPATHPYRPLLGDWSPRVLNDLDETVEFINAFPLADYRPFRIPGVGWFFVDDRSDVIKAAIVSGLPWESHVIGLYPELVLPGSVAVDVGSHIGIHTVALARLVGGSGRVYAFEPQRKLHRELHYNLALNDLSNAVPLRYAIGQGGARVINMNPATPGNEGGTSVGAGGDAVELRSLDSFGLGRLSLLKIDAEGMEDQVLLGAKQTIRATCPAIVVEAFGGDWLDRHSEAGLKRARHTLGILEGFGYEVSHIKGYDYLALPADCAPVDAPEVGA